MRTETRHPAAPRTGRPIQNSTVPVSPDLVWLATFDSVATVLTPQPLPVTSPEVLDHIRTLPSRLNRNGATNLTAAIDAALQVLANLPRPLGRRLTIIGDGEANRDQDKLADRALALRQNWVSARCIDVGNGAGRATLSMISGLTVGGYYDVAADYSELARLIGARKKAQPQRRTCANVVLVDTSWSMSSPFHQDMNRIEAAQRACAEWVATMISLYGGRS